MRKKILVIIIIWLVLVAGIILLTHKTPVKSTSSIPTTPYLEKGSAGNQPNFSVQGTSELNNHLLSQQYVAVQQEIGSYVQSKISASVSSATIVSGSTVLNNNGSINFSVQISNPNISFNVLLQFPSDEEIIFSVLGTNYQTTLYPYGDGSSTTN
jgi:hypothetical protein